MVSYSSFPFEIMNDDLLKKQKNQKQRIRNDEVVDNSVTTQMFLFFSF